MVTMTYISRSSDFAVYLELHFDVWTSYFGIMSPCDPTFDLKMNVGCCDLMVQWFCHIFWRPFDIWACTLGFRIMSLCDLTFDLKINVGPCDLYFTVQWFCLISWRPFDIWTSYLVIMSPCDPTFDLKINVGRYDLYFTIQWFCLISWRPFDVWTSYFGIMSPCDPTFDLKCRSLWPIFHGPVILPYILKTIWLWTSYLGVMSPCDPTFDLAVTYISWSGDFALYLENFSMVEHHTLGLWISMTQHLTSKYL